MAGKQAKLLTCSMVSSLLRIVQNRRYPERDRVIILLSVKAGLRAAEIAQLTWPMVCNAKGYINHCIELQDYAAKKRGGRSIPIHPELRQALRNWLEVTPNANNHVIISERGSAMRPSSIVNWFASLYKEMNFVGCSSHSGRRSFVTGLARNLAKAGGSLKDVQQLAGHSSLETTQAYIEGDSNIKRKLVRLI